jgi:OOP family OmpA-OmpF porin
MRTTAIAVGAALLLAAGGAQAQRNPSEDQIIRSLQPTGTLSATGRGIRPLAPAAPVAEPPSAVAPASSSAAPARPRPARPTTATAQPQAAPSAPSVNLTVQFATNSAQLTPEAVRTLDALGRALSSATLSSYRFRIEGHTDTVGSPDTNKALSARRAEAVVDYLATKFSLDRTRMEPVGMGEDGLLVQTPPQVADPRNRRVQVVNLGA